MIFETVENCPLCERQSDYKFVHCTPPEKVSRATGIDEILYIMCDCGLHYQMWMMTPETLAEYYRDQYRTSLATPGVTDWNVKMEGNRANRILKFLNGNISPNKVLDIGSSTGELLRKMRNKYKCEILGIEPNDNFREYSQGHGINTLSGIEYLNGKQEFDLITMVHVLEHLTEPIRFLEEVREFVADDGKLVIDIPILNYRLSHPIAYTTETLAMVLDEAGFEIGRLGSTREGSIAVEAHCDPEHRLRQIPA